MLRKNNITREQFIEMLKGLEGKKLVCPGNEPADLCHGNVIVRAIEWLGKNDNV